MPDASSVPLAPAPRVRAFRPADRAAVARLAGDAAIADAMISIPHPLDAAAAAALLVS